eukprot:10993054-Lingulodinium_polyedra.AAC.1
MCRGGAGPSSTRSPAAALCPTSPWHFASRGSSCPAALLHQRPRQMRPSPTPAPAPEPRAQ